MLTKIFSLSLLAAVSCAANAITVTSANIADTQISNASGANMNTARNSDFSVTALNSSSQFWAKFSGSSLKTAITGSTLDDLSLRFSGVLANDNTTVQFYFNSNAAWTLPASGVNSTNQNAATTPSLTYNTSGQSGATNSRFLGTTALLATYSFGAHGDVESHVIDLALTGDSLLRSAIAAGDDFTIFAKVSGIGRLSVVSTEGVSAYQADGRFGSQTVAPLTLVANVTPVPEPTSMVALGLGIAAIARRRKNA